jgi:hypothetical protein
MSGPGGAPVGEWGATEDPAMTAAQGMQLAARDIGKNGPTRPVQLGQVKTMTREELEVQKAEEARQSLGQTEGPSLRQEVESIKESIGQLAGVVKMLVTDGIPPSSSTPRPVAPSSPAIEPPPPSPQQMPTEPEAVESFPGMETSTPPVLPSTRLVESVGPESGPDEAPVVQALEPERVEAVRADTPRAKTALDAGPRVELMVNEVMSLLERKKPKLHFNRYVGQVNKYLGYQNWTPQLKRAFDERFADYLFDESFVQTIVQKLMAGENGHMVVPQHAATMCTLVAGFSAFATA